MSQGVRRVMALCWVWVSALAPFLHAHTGLSHVNGFHMDGLDVAHVQIEKGSQNASIAVWQGDESPAVGVGSSLPKPDPMPWLLDALAWVCLAFLLPRLVRQMWPCAMAGAPCAVRKPHARAGHPPPAAAPPFALI